MVCEYLNKAIKDSKLDLSSIYKIKLLQNIQNIRKTIVLFSNHKIFLTGRYKPRPF